MSQNLSSAAVVIGALMVNICIQFVPRSGQIKGLALTISAWIQVSDLMEGSTSRRAKSKL